MYIWDQETGEVLQKLRGHNGVVYEAGWNAKQGMLASCSDDQTVKVWHYDEKVINCLFIYFNETYTFSPIFLSEVLLLRRKNKFFILLCFFLRYIDAIGYLAYKKKEKKKIHLKIYIISNNNNNNDNKITQLQKWCEGTPINESNLTR